MNLQAELSSMIWLPQLELAPRIQADRHAALVDAIAAEDETTARALAEDTNAASVRRLIALRMELTQR